jgi:hypothetical protein
VADDFIARWQKSTYSMGAAQCVELARLPGGDVAVRDSKDQNGPVLRFSASEWRAFISGVKKGSEFDFRF